MLDCNINEDLFYRYSETGLKESIFWNNFDVR